MKFFEKIKKDYKVIKNKDFSGSEKMMPEKFLII